MTIAGPVIDLTVQGARGEGILDVTRRLLLAGTTLTSSDGDAMHNLATYIAGEVGAGIVTDAVAARDAAEGFKDDAEAAAAAAAALAGDLFNDGPVTDFLDDPPADPADGAYYLVGNDPSGDWVGHERELARWNDGDEVWAFLTPREGLEVFITASSKWLRYSGGWWQTKVYGDPGASYITFSNFPDGTLASAITKEGGGKAWSKQGAGATTETVTGGILRPTVNAVGGNCYNVLPIVGLNVHAEAEYVWHADGAANWSLTLGKGGTIIEKMIHVAGGSTGNMDITLWGASFVSNFMGVDQPNILEQDIPGGVTTVTGNGAAPGPGERFKVGITVIGDACRVAMFNEAGEFVRSKSFIWDEIPTIIGDYSYAQSQGADAVGIYSHRARPVDVADFNGLLPPLFENVDTNAPVVRSGACAFSTATTLTDFTPTDGIQYAFQVDLQTITDASIIGAYAQCARSWIVLVKKYSGTIAVSTPGAIYAEQTLSTSSGDISLSCAFSVAINGSKVDFKATPTRSGANATSYSPTVQMTIRSLGAAATFT